MQSMTGYGESNFLLEGVRFHIRIKSLNSKSLEIMTLFPSEMAWFSNLAESLIRKKITRGKITCFIEYEGSLPIEPEVDMSLVKTYEQIYQKYYKKKNMQIPIDSFIKLPGVFGEKIKNFYQYQKKFEFQFSRALVRTEKQRQSEGKKLITIMKKKFSLLLRLNSKMESLFDKSISTTERIYSKRFLRFMLTHKLLEKKKATRNEVARKEMQLARLFWGEAKDEILPIFQSDITEEIDRLKIHLKESSNITEERNDIGRKLEFFLQEILREINTLAAKTSETQINKIAILMKVEIEKLREQVRNLA